MQLVGILQYKMLYVNGRRSFFRLRVCVCVWTGCCAHRSVRFLMYSSVELSCSRSIRNPKVCFEALTALLATASMWSAASLWLRGRKKKTQKKDVVKGESEFQRITDHYNCPRRDGNGFQHRRLPLHWLRSQDFSNYHIIVAHRRSSRGGIDSRRPDNYVSDKLEGRKRGEMLHGFKQRSLIIIGQIKVSTNLFIRTCESLTMMFHLFGPDSTSKGMICEGGRNSKKDRFSCSNRWRRKGNHVNQSRLKVELVFFSTRCCLRDSVLTSSTTSEV